MKVALNAALQLSGFGQYTYHLAKDLRALPEQELDLFYSFGWSKEVRVNPAFVSANEISNLCRCISSIKKLIGLLPKFKCDQCLKLRTNFYAAFT